MSINEMIRVELITMLPKAKLLSVLNFQYDLLLCVYADSEKPNQFGVIDKSDDYANREFVFCCCCWGIPSQKSQIRIKFSWHCT